MAILHRNPMPLNGALFVTNPRRRKNSKKRSNGIGRKRNALQQRRNALTMLRRNAEQISLFDGGMNIASPKKTATPKRSTSKGKTMAKGKTYKQMQKEGAALGLKVIGVPKADLAKSIAAEKKRKPAKKSKPAKKGKPAKKATVSSVTTTRKKSAWSKFLPKVKGLSLTRAQVKNLYAQHQKDPKKADKKIVSFKKKVRAEASKLKGSKVGRGYLRKGRKSILASDAFLNNPMKKINPRRRKNQGIMGIQPLALPLTLVQDVQSEAAKLPVVSFLSFAITPIALGATVYGVHKLAEPHVMKFLDETVANVPVLKETLKFPYTTTGIVAGLALGLLAKNNLLNAQAASLVAASAVSVGMGLDLSLRSFAKAATDVASTATVEANAAAAVVAAEAIEEATGVAPANGAMGAIQMGAIHTNPSSYGDGGQYMIGRASQALGNYGAVHMGAVHMGSATGLVEPEYQDASPADAQVCTCVMTPDEVASAKAGRDAFRRKFGRSPRNMKSSQSLRSRHAGRAGHRFGWLIKMIGFENFQKIASLPPKRRAIVISQLQKQAIASIPALIQAQAQRNASLETASLPVQGTLNGAHGFEGVGYGAMMFAGQGY
jgi:hypothetical protein